LRTKDEYAHENQPIKQDMHVLEAVKELREQSQYHRAGQSAPEASHTPDY
jgi:hypothetical protein